jgi:hypothetical protein
VLAIKYVTYALSIKRFFQSKADGYVPEH